jgi:hypothetical protein
MCLGFQQVLGGKKVVIKSLISWSRFCCSQKGERESEREGERRKKNRRERERECVCVFICFEEI